MHCGAPWQGCRYLFAKLGRGPQVVPRVEQVVDRFTGEREYFVEYVLLGCDMREERRRGEIDPRDAAVGSGCRPTRAAAVRNDEIFFVALRFANEIGFELLQTFPVRS